MDWLPGVYLNYPTFKNDDDFFYVRLENNIGLNKIFAFRYKSCFRNGSEFIPNSTCDVIWATQVRNERWLCLKSPWLPDLTWTLLQNNVYDALSPLLPIQCCLTANVSMPCCRPMLRGGRGDGVSQQMNLVVQFPTAWDPCNNLEQNLLNLALPTLITTRF